MQLSTPEHLEARRKQLGEAEAAGAGASSRRGASVTLCLSALFKGRLLKRTFCGFVKLSRKWLGWSRKTAFSAHTPRGRTDAYYLCMPVRWTATSRHALNTHFRFICDKRRWSSHVYLGPPRDSSARGPCDSVRKCKHHVLIAGMYVDN